MSLMSKMNLAASRYALIVDDDPGILGVYEMALSDLGFTPILATDGNVALRHAQESSPALVILDQRMPGLTGLELLRQMRAGACRETPIIMVSAGRHIQDEALASGATACLEKPFDVEELIATVLSHTRNETALSA